MNDYINQKIIKCIKTVKDEFTNKVLYKKGHYYKINEVPTLIGIGGFYYEIYYNDTEFKKISNLGENLFYTHFITFEQEIINFNFSLYLDQFGVNTKTFKEPEFDLKNDDIISRKEHNLGLGYWVYVVTTYVEGYIYFPKFKKFLKSPNEFCEENLFTYKGNFILQNNYHKSWNDFKKHLN